MEAFAHHFHDDSLFQTITNYNNNNHTFFTQQTTYPSSDQHHHLQINYTQNIDSKSSSLDYSSPTKTVCYYSDENVMNSMDENKKNRDGSCLNSAKLKDGREGKCRKQKKCDEGKSKLETKKAKNEKIKEKTKNAEEPPLGYIHVRARRGQATDSHSLAERVRREKISERMKLLQSLVPGCDKVTGKALMLEEIINYVQSLQHQVEFLSMKLACFNPTIYDFGVDPTTLMMRSERLNGLASTTPLPFVQQCGPTSQPIVFGDSIAETTAAAATTFISPHSSQYSGVDPLALVQHGHRLPPFTEDNASQLWEVDGPKQKLMNLSSLFDNNNMCSFN